MSVSLQTRMNTELGPGLTNPLVAVAPAWLGMKGVFVWALAGGMGGTLLDLLLKTDVQSLFVGGGIGVGMMVGFYLKDKSAREDPSLPGGQYVILGATSDELVVISRSLWGLKNLKIEAREPYGTIASINVEKKFGSSVAVTFSFVGGRSWRYEVNKWKDLQPSLPPALFDNQSL